MSRGCERRSSSSIVSFPCSLWQEPGRASCKRSLVIEKCAKGKPFTIWAPPDTRCPVLYFKDAARAIVELAQIPVGSIKSVNYLLAGADPIASAGELADMVRARIPGTQIDFRPNPALQPILAKVTVRFDDRRAHEEWGWEPHYTQEQIVDDFLSEMRLDSSDPYSSRFRRRGSRSQKKTSGTAITRT